jgi:hypothetical protein
MKILYLHIGMHKTGSSAVQRAFANARTALLRQGICYPGEEVNHAELYFAFSPSPHTEHRNIRRGIETPCAATALQRGVLAQFAGDLERDQSAKILLSAEGLCALDPPGIERLRDFLSQYVERIVVICFVRSPVSFSVSYAQEAILGGTLIQESLERPQLPQYRQRLGNYLHVFGRESMHVLNYDEIREQGESLSACVLEIMGQRAALEGLINEDKVNTALSLEAALIFDFINQSHPIFINGRRNIHRANIPRSWFDGIGNTRFSMPTQWQESVSQRCELDTQWLRENFAIHFDRGKQFVPFTGWGSEAERKLMSDVSEILHRNAALIDACSKEALFANSTLAEMRGEYGDAVRMLRYSLAVDPDQPHIEAKMQALQALQGESAPERT